MDQELLMALFFLWSSTSTALVIFMSLWLMNESEALHPHSVDVDNRHTLFLVVKSETICKHDFAVKSISAFVAPRGATSSKWFTVLIIVMSISGMFGSFRWYKVGDAGLLETSLSMVGFGALMFLAAFETDVSSARFLEEKLIVTAWLINALNGDKVLPFRLTPENKEFRFFLRQSPKIYQLYEEDHPFRDTKDVPSLEDVGPYTPLWCSLHIIGAVCYLLSVSSAVIFHEREEETIAHGVISWSSFYVFCFAGYLTGTYFPVVRSLQCIVLIWNPFLRQPDYLSNLKQAIDDYLTKTNSSNSSHSIDSLSSATDPSIEQTTTTIKRKTPKNKLSSAQPPTSSFTLSIDAVLSRNIFLYYAMKKPNEYRRSLGLFFVLTEMVAVLTPSVAIGIQWMAALCPTQTAKQAILGFLYISFQCFVYNNCETKEHCLFSPE